MVSDQELARFLDHSAEHATDVMFTSPKAMEPLYERLLKDSIVRFSAEDVLTFLGRKLDGRFQGEQLNCWGKRHPGARVKTLDEG